MGSLKIPLKGLDSVIQCVIFPFSTSYLQLGKYAPNFQNMLGTDQSLLLSEILFQVDIITHLVPKSEFIKRQTYVLFFPNCPADIKVLTGSKQINPSIVVSRLNKFRHELLI